MHFSNAIVNCGSTAGDNAENGGVCPWPLSSNTGWASNSVDVQIEDDEELYETARAIDLDDDRHVPPLSEEDIELMRRFCSNRDPLVHEFSDLRDCDGAYAEGRDDELLEAPDVGDSMEVRKGLVFKDLTTLKRWLQEYAVKRKRPFKVTHSYVERRYTVVCKKNDCNWRVCARKQKATGKFKITKVVGQHICSEKELHMRHQQLT